MLPDIKSHWHFTPHFFLGILDYFVLDLLWTFSIVAKCCTENLLSVTVYQQPHTLHNLLLLLLLLLADIPNYILQPYIIHCLKISATFRNHI